jgi:hypothetical protein
MNSPNRTPCKFYELCRVVVRHGWLCSTFSANAGSIPGNHWSLVAGVENFNDYPFPEQDEIILKYVVQYLADMYSLGIHQKFRIIMTADSK